MHVDASVCPTGLPLRCRERTEPPVSVNAHHSIARRQRGSGAAGPIGDVVGTAGKRPKHFRAAREAEFAAVPDKNMAPVSIFLSGSRGRLPTCTSAPLMISVFWSQWHVRRPQ
jgi:hypothetical protein